MVSPADDGSHPAVVAANGLAASAALIATDPDAFDATATSSQLTDFMSSTFAAAGAWVSRTTCTDAAHDDGARIRPYAHTRTCAHTCIHAESTLLSNR